MSFNVDHGGFNTPTIDLINAYEKGDKRLDASIGMVEGKLTDSYALDAGVKSIVDYEPAPGITAYPFYQKYFRRAYKTYYTDGQLAVYITWVLLFLAEAINEQNRTRLSLSVLPSAAASIRGRAGLAPVKSQNVDALRVYLPEGGSG